MKNHIRITVLIENTAYKVGLLAEHGLSYWIETDTHKVLFDTGQRYEVLRHNAEQLKCHLSELDAVVLSHGHYDHTGGLPGLLQAMRIPQMYLHPASLIKHYGRKKDTGLVEDIGVPSGIDEPMLKKHVDELIWTDKPTSITDGIHVTGPVPRDTDYEDVGGPFFLDKEATQPDPILDDQSIFFNTPLGTVVILGCAHAGVINTLNHVRRLTDNQPIHAVIGGMHLVNASEHRIEQTGRALRELDVQMLVPAHCTGPTPKAWLWSQFPDRWQACHVGKQFEFELAY